MPVGVPPFEGLARAVLVQVGGKSIVDDAESLLAEAGYAVEHLLDGFGAVAFPGLEFFDDSEWVPGSVGLGDIAGEPLVGDVGVASLVS